MDALAKIRYFLLVVLIFSLPVGVLSRIDLGNAVAFTLNDTLVALIALSLGVSVILRNNVKGKLFRPIVLFVAALLFSIIVNLNRFDTSELLISSLYLLRWVAYSSIYFSVVELDLPFKKKLLKYMGFSILIYITLGFFQLILYPNLRNLFYAGWDEHLYRIFGTLLDPNFSGLILVLGFILLLTQREIFQNKSFRNLILSLTFIGVILTFSRTSVLALIVSLVAYLYIRKDRGILYLLILATLFMGTFYLIVPKKESTNVFRTASTLARFESYKEGIKIFKDNPVFGVGFNSYRYALEEYGFSDKMKYGPSHGASGNDSSFLFVLATAGTFGFLTFLYLIYSFVKTSTAPLRTLSVICIAFGSLFVNAFFFVFILEWLWIVTGATENT